MQDNSFDYYDNLFKKYQQKGSIIDSNLLLYYFIGEYNINLVKLYKRTNKYGIDGYRAVKLIIEHFDKIITSPYIYTEISNLSNYIDKKYKYDYYNSFYERLSLFEEKLDFTIDFFNDRSIRKLGITDTNIFHLAKNKYLVITDDLALSEYLSKNNIDVINFNHIYFEMLFRSS
jgi:hypothetical protein